MAEQNCADAFNRYLQTIDNFNSIHGDFHQVFVCDGIPQCEWDEDGCNFARAQNYNEWAPDRADPSNCQYIRKRPCISSELIEILDDNLAAQKCVEGPSRIDELTNAEASNFCGMNAGQFGNACSVLGSIVTNTAFTQIIKCQDPALINPGPIVGPVNPSPISDPDGESKIEKSFPIWIPIVIVVAIALIATIIAVWYCKVNFYCCFKSSSNRNFDDLYHGREFSKSPTTPHGTGFRQSNSNATNITERSRYPGPNQDVNQVSNGNFPVPHDESVVNSQRNTATTTNDTRFSHNSSLNISNLAAQSAPGTPMQGHHKPQGGPPPVKVRYSRSREHSPNRSSQDMFNENYNQLHGVHGHHVTMRDLSGSVVASTIGPSVSERAAPTFNYLANKSNHTLNSNTNTGTVKSYHPSQVTSITMSQMTQRDNEAYDGYEQTQLPGNEKVQQFLNNSGYTYQ